MVKVDVDLLWIKKHRKEYQGYWVALKDGKKLAKSKSLKKLVSKLDSVANVVLANLKER